jgi:hypothetical protein
VAQQKYAGNPGANNVVRDNPHVGPGGFLANQAGARLEKTEGYELKDRERPDDGVSRRRSTILALPLLAGLRAGDHEVHQLLAAEEALPEVVPRPFATISRTAASSPPARGQAFSYQGGWRGIAACGP